jgi:midasin
MQLWWETYQIASTAPFEDAIFQAHLGIYRDILSREQSKLRLPPTRKVRSQQNAKTQAPYRNIVELVQGLIEHYFESGFKLTTGLSMEKLWRSFRPKPISSIEKLQTLVNMEELAIRFDHLKWKASTSVTELSSISSSLVEAYNLILTSEVDGRSLVQILSTEITKLEAETDTDQKISGPFFSDQFEALRQYDNLGYEGAASDALTLASNPTVSLMHLKSATSTSICLQKVDYIWGNRKTIFPIEDSFSASLLRRLQHIGDVELSMLSLLEIEMPILGHHIAQGTAVLSQNQLLDMNMHLIRLLNEIIRVHNKSLVPEFENLARKLTGSTKETVFRDKLITIDLIALSNESKHLPHFQEVLLAYLQPALNAIIEAVDKPRNQMKFSSLAWVHFAIGCITLYVPDRSFDPCSRQLLERQQHDHAKEKLENKLAALRTFEQMFTGQNNNLPCQLLEEELLELGEPSEIIQEVLRPHISELDQLQGEFNNLLNIVLRARPLEIVNSYLKYGHEGTEKSIELLQNNVARIIRRLSERFRAYGDMTVPVVGMLQCLQVGLHMARLAISTATISQESIENITNITPFLGGGPLEEAKAVPGQPLDTLTSIAMAACVEGLDSFNHDQRQIFLDTVHSCYMAWSKKLEADQKKAESKSGLYRFRGSAEDEEEHDRDEFNELFPDFDGGSTKSANNIATAHPARDTAVHLAKTHAKIVLGGSTPADSIIFALRSMSERVGNFYDGHSPFSSGLMTNNLLPGVLLKLSNHMEALKSGSAAADSYNFYTDANLPEARKLLLLIQQIQTRFRELQNVDEIGHMQPLEDVMLSCRELLRFRHTEPLAKIITQVEKIHTYMHEWQFGGWAGRANSVLTLYDQLTSTIISWRRLELATWARLFDMENKKCDDDAKSWWFVAYEVVIAAPLSMCQSQSELRSYTQKLLQDLETYFTTAIQGQFSQRLQLLKQLQRHLEIIIIDIPQISFIWNAVKNFTSIYTRYEKPVTEYLQKGRALLEKEMRDVLLLASWKDTNIVALRDSSRRSHHKLFKLVRKYRALLGQPMEQILKNGLPEENRDLNSDVTYNAPRMLPNVDTNAMVLCESRVPNWSKKSQRFINISKTVALMDNAVQIPAIVLDGSQYLESFLSNIITSITELQKTTPSILTEENKATVKHLKSRKRKLFADTLRGLRQMGIKHNLDTTSLSKQASLVMIFSNTKSLLSAKSQAFDGLEYYYHKVIDLIPRARAAARQHSQDLSSAEVIRSIGLLEGLLEVLLKQRNKLAVLVADAEKLEKTIQMVQALWAPDKYEITRAIISPKRAPSLKWLPSILRVGFELVRIHGQVGGLENTEVLNWLSSQIKIFDDLELKWANLPILPPGISSTAIQNLHIHSDDAVGRLRISLCDLIERYPNLAFILNQIRPWAVANWEAVPMDVVDGNISVVDEILSKICDSIFVALKRFSTSLEKLPGSAEDAAWLVRTESCMCDNMTSLHVPDITARINKSFSLLNGIALEHDGLGKVVGAIFIVAQPIFQQYLSIVEQSVTRYATIHRATCKTTYILAKTFTQIASQGFCTPSEKSGAQDGKTEKLEDGTGLGDGEGADDISKDIKDDEDLSELAQEPNIGDREEIEDEKDAVDIADGDMEGEMGENEERGEDEEGSGGNETDGDDIDEEAGDVDDLDPNTVDEKMWDGEGEKAEKEQEGDQSKGKANKDEQVAAQENDNQPVEGEDGEEHEEEFGAEQSEEVKQDEVEKHDPHAQEGQALELPEQMELDGNEQEGSTSSSDDGMDDLSNVNDDTKDGDEADGASQQISDGEDEEMQDDQDVESDIDIVDLDKDEDRQGKDTEEAGEKANDEPEPDTEDQKRQLRGHSDDATMDSKDIVASDVQGTVEDHIENQAEDNSASKSNAQRDEGEKGGKSSEQEEAAADDGDAARKANGEASQDPNEDTQDSALEQPFKKLGDALERWHRQQTKLRDPSENQENSREQPMEVDMDNDEFQHLQDEDAKADTQALGTAREDQAQALDESMAIEVEDEEMPYTSQPDKEETDSHMHDDSDPKTSVEQEEPKPNEVYEGRPGAMIKQAVADQEERYETRAEENPELEEDIEEVDVQLSSTHIDDPNTFIATRSANGARQLWTHYEAMTRDHSLSLTEQLRLILAPTQATKMRGDFRTGKRLNIKRIIPYIASQYKRDKIWMRRSVPSKRSYQIMLAVDDSKSMGESGSGSLAFETLVMISKSLSMLEVGEICIVSFGESVRVAHDFETPFSNEAGPKVFQNFGFDQDRTDITKLVKQSIELFRTARAKASSSPTDLWQLELIISDGVCDSSEHEPIRRLLREAIEERIMMVFVIVDDLKNKKSGESVMDLKEAKFVKDEATGVSNVKIERYLDTFPFQYYLIVSDVKELPGVLATLLRQWFAEVADSSA